MSKSVLGTSVLAQVAGLLTDFFEKLAGSDGTVWLNAFRRFLRKENPWPKFPTWRTIRIGTHRSADELRGAIIAAGNQISEWGGDILSKVCASRKAKDLELVMVTVAELGFENGATLREIYERAKTLGLDLCPAEAGPQLRLQYTDQPMNEWLLVAMEPITDSDGYLRVFSVARNSDGSWLRASYVGPGRVWSSDDRWVFARRK